MAVNVPESKLSAGDVAAQAVDAVEHEDEEVITDVATRQVKASLPTDESSLYREIQQRWDANDWPWRS